MSHLAHVPSRPVRARGLKRCLVAHSYSCRVAPRTGAWIETRRALLRSAAARSRPVRARGLKRSNMQGCATVFEVAPRTGAWIETCSLQLQIARTLGVAPRTGAWIETASCRRVRTAATAGRAPYGRVD